MPIDQDLQQKFLDACRDGNLEVFHLMIKESLPEGKISLTQNDDAGNCSLFKAIDIRSEPEDLGFRADKLEILNCLLEKLGNETFNSENLDIFLNNDTETILNFAAKNLFTGAVRSILNTLNAVEIDPEKCKEYVNYKRGQYSESALSNTVKAMASKILDLEILELLLSSGANPNEIDTEGYTMIGTLVSWNAKNTEARKIIDAVDLLLRHGADIDKVGEQGIAPLMDACESSSSSAVNLLLKKGANPNIASQVRKRTALHIAATCDRPDIVALLLKHGANIDQKKADGDTALKIACASKNHVNSAVIASYLAQYGADFSDAPPLEDVVNKEIHTLMIRTALLSKEINMAILEEPFKEEAFIKILKNKENSDIVKSAIVSDCAPEKNPMTTAAEKGNVRALEILNARLAKVTRIKTTGFSFDEGAAGPAASARETVSIEGVVAEAASGVADSRLEDRLWDLSIKLIDATKRSASWEIKSLIDKGGDPAMQNEDGETALGLAIGYVNKELGEGYVPDPEAHDSALDIMLELSKSPTVKSELGKRSALMSNGRSLAFNLVNMAIPCQVEKDLKDMINIFESHEFTQQDKEDLIANAKLHSARADSAVYFLNLIELSDGLKDCIYITEYTTGPIQRIQETLASENKSGIGWNPGIVSQAIKIKIPRNAHSKPQNLFDLAKEKQKPAVTEYLTATLTENALREIGVDDELQLGHTKSPSPRKPSAEPKGPSAGAASGTSVSSRGFGFWQ